MYIPTDSQQGRRFHRSYLFGNNGALESRCNKRAMAVDFVLIVCKCLLCFSGRGLHALKAKSIAMARSGSRSEEMDSFDETGVCAGCLGFGEVLVIALFSGEIRVFVRVILPSPVIICLLKQHTARWFYKIRKVGEMLLLLNSGYTCFASLGINLLSTNRRFPSVHEV